MILLPVFPEPEQREIDLAAAELGHRLDVARRARIVALERRAPGTDEMRAAGHVLERDGAYVALERFAAFLAEQMAGHRRERVAGLPRERRAQQLRLAL